jgi:hypothetical protein
MEVRVLVGENVAVDVAKRRVWPVFESIVESLTRLHPLAGFGEAKPLESLGRESKGRHYTGSEGSGGRAEGRGRDFWWGLGGEVELQALQQE